MSSHIVARTCYFCGKCIVPEPQQGSSLESSLLTEDLIASHPGINGYGRHLFEDRQILAQERICRRCLQCADRLAVDQKTVQQEESQKSLPLTVGKIQLPDVSEYPVPGFTRVAYSSSKCIIAGCLHRQRLRMISRNIRRAVLSKQNIYIPRGTGVCEKHDVVEPRWSDLGAYCRPRRELFRSTHMADMLKMMQSVCRRKG